MTSCRELTEQASDYLEHQLSRRRRLAIRLHLLICEGCRRRTVTLGQAFTTTLKRFYIV